MENVYLNKKIALIKNCAILILSKKMSAFLIGIEVVYDKITTKLKENILLV